MSKCPPTVAQLVKAWEGHPWLRGSIPTKKNALLPTKKKKKMSK